MQSGIKVFSKNGIRSAGRLLPADEFRLFADMKDRSIDPKKAEIILKKAEQFLVEDLTVIPLSLYRDKFLTGIRSNYEAPHHKRRDMLFYMTLAEIHENKGRFVEKIADVAWAIMEETAWVIPAHQGNSLMRPGSDVPEIIEEHDVPGMDLYAAIASALLAFVKYYLGDKLDAISPVICERIDHLVYLRGVRPYILGNFWWMQSSCNWLTSITANILLAAAITVKDKEILARTVDKSLELLDRFTAAYPEDGCCAEGPFYWEGAAGSLFDCLELLEDMSGGKINVYHEPILANMCRFITTMNINERYFVNFEDATPRLSIYGDMIERMGVKFCDESLKSYGKYASSLMTDKYYYFFGMPYRAMKDAITPTVLEAPKVKGRLSSWLAGHSIAVFRECEDTSKGLFLATKGGNNGEPGNHNDVGCLVIFSNGNPIAVDPGIGSYNNNYFAEERYLRWFVNSNAHSCPEINGYQQMRGKTYSSSDEQCDIAERTVSMNIAGAYPSEAGIERLVRSCKLGEGSVTVTDDVLLTEEGTYTFHLTLVNHPEKIGEGIFSIGDGRTLTYDSSIFTAALSRVENKCMPYDDLDIKHHWGVECLWDLALTAKAKNIKCIITVK